MGGIWALLSNSYYIFIFDSVVLICAIYLASRESAKYKKTNKEYHNYYSQFFICAAMELMPFMLTMLLRWKVIYPWSIIYDVTSAVFVIAGLFYFLKAENLRKKSE